MNMNLELIENLNVAYIRRIGPYGSDNYAVMDSLKKWAEITGRLEGGVIYAIAYDDPDGNPQHCRFDACLVVEPDFVPEEPVQKGVIQGGMHAIFEVRHSAYAMELFWSHLYENMEKARIKIDETRPVMERYRKELMERGCCEFCVPVCL